MSKTVYHGSDRIIKHPNILRPTRRMDFGPGFYCTTDKNQAQRWVKTKINDGQTGYINIFSFDTKKISSLKIRIFEEPNNEWIDFVEQNRRNPSYEHDYDIVIGPVADDRVNASFSLYEQGIISRESLIERLQAYKLTDQILFHTKKALESIVYVSCEKVLKPLRVKSEHASKKKKL